MIQGNKLLVCKTLSLFSLCFLLSANARIQKSRANQAKPPSSIKGQLGADSNYADLLRPIDIYAVPASAKKLLGLKELHQVVLKRGGALKVSRETLNAAKELVKSEQDKKNPVLSLDAGHGQKWDKTLVDSDVTDEVADRERVVGSRTINSNLGLSLTGTPVKGVNYKLQFPQLVHSRQVPEPETPSSPRYDAAAFVGTVGVSLLRDNPLFAERLSQKKVDFTLELARMSFKSDMLKQLVEAESKFYSLVQRHLQLSVLERSFKLAKALESDVKEKILAGEASALEATRAELQTAQAEAEFMAAQIEYELAVGEFRNSLAYEDDEGRGVFPDPKALDVNVEAFQPPESALSIIQKNNPDIIAAQLAKNIAEIELEVSRKGTLPTLAFEMNYGNSAPAHGWDRASSEAIRPNDRTFGVALIYSQILYNDLTRNVLRSSIVAKQKAEFSADETQRKISKDYNSLVKKLEIGSRRYKIAKLSREIAERKLKSEYEKFKAGESSVRNVIDSQTEVNEARIGEISSRIEILNGYGTLRTLLGKLPDGISYNLAQ